MLRYLKKFFQKQPETVPEPIPKLPRKKPKMVLGSPGPGLHRVNLPNGMVLYSSWYRLPSVGQLEPITEVRKREQEYLRQLKEKREATQEQRTGTT